MTDDPKPTDPADPADAGDAADATAAAGAAADDHAVADDDAVADPTPEPEAGPSALILYLLRHADAGDPLAWPAGDAERPLSKKGRRQAKRLARHLKDLDVQLNHILTSPKLRASATAKIVGRGTNRKPVVDERLTIDFGAPELTALVSELEPGASSVMLVGHDPDFSDALAWLVGASIPLGKGALAAIDLPDREVGAGRGTLRWLLPPDAVAG